MNTWELCPKCKGNKKHFVTPIAEQDCNICNGSGIISSLTGLPPKRDYSTPLLNVPYIPTPPDRILDYRFEAPIKCDFNNAKNEYIFQIVDSLDKHTKNMIENGFVKTKNTI